MKWLAPTATPSRRRLGGPADHSEDPSRPDRRGSLWICCAPPGTIAFASDIAYCASSPFAYDDSTSSSRDASRSGSNGKRAACTYCGFCRSESWRLRPHLGSGCWRNWRLPERFSPRNARVPCFRNDWYPHYGHTRSCSPAVSNPVDQESVKSLPRRYNWYLRCRVSY